MIKFGTGGFRAIIGEDFTKENVQILAQGLSNLMLKENSKKEIVIGYDRRFMSDDFAKWMAEVFVGNSIKVLLCNREVPTPLVMLATKNFHNDYGLMITASHNPYVYNGVKVFTKGGKDGDLEFTNILEDECKKLTNINTLKYEFACKSGLIEPLEYMEEYIENVCNHLTIKKGNNAKIYFNAMNGVTVEPFTKISKKLNLKNCKLYRSKHDAFFEHSLPAPNETTLKSFAKKCFKDKVDFALACDADGDRVNLIDEKGNIYGGNTILAIIYYYLVKYKNMQGDVVINLSSSMLLEKIAEKFGYKCHKVPVGFKWLSSKMKETNALICGESSGGLTIRDYINGKDSMIACCLLIEAQQTINKPFSKIIDEICEFAEFRSVFLEKTFVVEDREALTKSLQKFVPTFSKKIVELDRRDGQKYYLENNSWVMIRFSGCEPILRIVDEAQDESDVNELMQQAIDFVSSLQKIKEQE